MSEGGVCFWVEPGRVESLPAGSLRKLRRQRTQAVWSGCVSQVVPLWSAGVQVGQGGAGRGSERPLAPQPRDDIPVPGDGPQSTGKVPASELPELPST